MQTPVPQPYDITDIPYIPWVPGTNVWATLAVALIALGMLVWRRGERHTPRRSLALFNTLLSELRACIHDPNSLHVERASRIARRLVSHISGRDIAELTSDELRALSDEELSPGLRPIMRALASFEEIAYAPESPNRDASARQLGTELVSHITTYRDELRVR